MTGRRIKQGKRCKVCGKELRDWNKSGLCSHHYKMKYWAEKRKERKKKHLCIMCGAKIKQIIKHYAYDVRPPIKIYPTRCLKCIAKEKIYQDNYYQKNGRKEKLKLNYQRPEVKVKFRIYNHKPYVKERVKRYQQLPEVKARIKKYAKEYFKIPGVKERIKAYKKEYNQRPEVKEKKKLYQREKRKKARLTKDKQKKVLLQ